MRLTPLRTLTVERPMASGHAFLSAASGLVVAGPYIYVAADDARELAVFDLGGDAAGRLFELIPGALPSDAKDRKKQKPDFEILLHLPQIGDHGSLLALGSGSKRRRMVGVLVALGSDGLPRDVRLIHLAPLYAQIEPLVDGVNIEGALVLGDRLLLFNRGNAAAPESCVVETWLPDMLAGVGTSVQLVTRFTLPEINGVPLTVTDACATPDGFMLSAAAEATDDSYADGELAGAALVRLDTGFAIISVEPIESTVKVEGIALAPDDRLLCVTDADDPDQPSILYNGLIE